MDENIKDSFKRVKQDMDFLREELNLTTKILNENRIKISEICDLLISMNNSNIELNERIKENTLKIHEFEEFKQKSTQNSTYRQINQANDINYPTDKLPLEVIKANILPISTGNEGVPTDKQTDTSTDKQTEKTQEITKKLDFNPQKQERNTLDGVTEALASLDGIKKELRLKFKRLTDQEISVFSLMYQLDDELGYSDYKLLSERLNLTESSIRDYVGRLIKKGIPVEKKKINNKLIQLTLSKTLKQIASLSTLLKLRDI